jgi:hypothetical protein
MMFDEVAAAILLLMMMGEARKTLPRKILSLGGQVTIGEWFAPPSDFKIYNQSHFIREDDIILYQSQ